MMSGAVELRFDDYQERCLYDPDHGFFATSGGAGRRGDFITSPEVGPLFGEVLARHVSAVWHALGEPTDFCVVEVGAGRGALMASMRRAWAEMATAEEVAGAPISWCVVEQSAALRRSAVELLGSEVDVRAELPTAPIAGVVIANELLDNLPVRIVERTTGGWSEVWVRIDEGGASEVLRPTESNSFSRASIEWLDGFAKNAVVGTRMPIHEQGRRWVVETLRQMVGGSLIVVDYGVIVGPELVDRTWLRTYRSHERGDDPYDSPMERDITADIVVDQLPPPTRVSTQADVLKRWGIGDLVAEGRRVWVERAHLGDLAALRARSRVTEAEALEDPIGLGGFLVLEWDVDGHHADSTPDQTPP